jgi:hypothetical protein
MKPQYQHNVATSFALWFDHHLLSKGEAFANQTGKFYNYEDPRIPSTYKVFGSPHKQFVFDSSISGAIVPSGVFVNSVFKPRSNGLIMDYMNGRVLTTGVAATANITGAYSVKDFNIYMSNEDEEDLIIENNLEENAKFPWSGTYIQPYDELIPAVFIIADSIKNKPFAFGGEDETRSNMKCVVFTDNPYHLDGVLSLFADSQKKVFTEKDFGDYPLTEYGDVKSYPYNYDNYYSNPNPSVELFIDDVTVSKLKDTRSRSSNVRTYIGFIDFEVTQYRYPRA